MIAFAQAIVWVLVGFFGALVTLMLVAFLIVASIIGAILSPPSRTITHTRPPRGKADGRAEYIMELMPYITAALRWAIGLLAGWLLAHGIITQDQTGQFTTLALSMVVAAVPLVWSLIQKARTAAHIADAAAASPNAPVKGTPL